MKQSFFTYIKYCNKFFIKRTRGFNRHKVKNIILYPMTYWLFMWYCYRERKHLMSILKVKQ